MKMSKCFFMCNIFVCGLRLFFFRFLYFFFIFLIFHFVKCAGRDSNPSQLLSPPLAAGFVKNFILARVEVSEILISELAGGFYLEGSDSSTELPALMNN